tara:strand:+ start:582 stop:2612 length:2031 start_codon:yes stop_codon:yes gene_type:complete
MSAPTSVTGGKIATFSEGKADVFGRVNNWAAEAGGWAVDAFTPKASEIFEKRSATQIFTTHEGIALESIKGGRTTEFSENENLYGFSILRFTKGIIGGGWFPAKVNNLLSSNLDSFILGNDELAGANSYFFNLHPKALNLSEPFATHIMPTQGGGVYVESQGIVLRTLTIAGTTGYRPAMVGIPGDNNNNIIPHQPGEPTGFLNLLKLRNLFRNYADLKKDKSLSYKVYLVWYNNKEQEAWFFEPTNFSTMRDAASPFTYDYSISGTLTQKVSFSTVVNTINPDPTSIHFQIATLRRSAAMINSIVGGLIPGLGNDVVGDVQNLTRQVLDQVDSIDRAATGVAMNVAAIAQIPTVLVAAAYPLVQGLKKSISDLVKNQEAIWDTDYDAWADNWTANNEKFLELFQATDELTWAMTAIGQPENIADIVSSTKAPGSPSVDKKKLSHPNTGADYSDSEWRPVKIPKETTLADLVFNSLGDDSAVAAVAEYNGLEPPFITDTPVYVGAFTKFLTQGDIIYLPFPKELVSGDINTKINPLKTSLSLYEESLGRDLRLNKSTQATTGVSEFNLTISPTGDLDLVGGRDNIIQAIDIKLNTERGELAPHPEFGIVFVVGHKGNRNLNFNLYLSLNDTMLSDGRIKELVDTRVNISGDIASVKTKVHVIGHVPYVPVSFTMVG